MTICACVRDISNVIGIASVATIIAEYAHSIPSQYAFDYAADCNVCLMDRSTYVVGPTSYVKKCMESAPNIMTTIIRIVRCPEFGSMIIGITHAPKGAMRGAWRHARQIDIFESFNHGPQNILEFILNDDLKSPVQLDYLPDDSREHIHHASRILADHIASTQGGRT